MTTKLAEKFRDSDGAPIEVAGQMVHMMYELPPLRGATRVRIELKTGSSRPQALRLKIGGGHLLLNEEPLDDVVIWSDTAPAVVTGLFIPQREGEPVSVNVWNAWRDGAGVMQAWIGDAGLIVDWVSSDALALRCSDGYDGVNFDDLDVRLTIGR